MDDFFKEFGKGFSEQERWEINKPAAEVFKKALIYHIDVAENHHPYRNKYYKHERKGIIDNIAANKEHGGAVKVGVTRKSKKAYIARFLNDGWTPRNQRGGPYLPPIEPEHFWEDAMDQSAEGVKDAERESLREVLRKRGLL